MKSMMNRRLPPGIFVLVATAVGWCVAYDPEGHFASDCRRATSACRSADVREQENLALMIDPLGLLGLSQRGASSFLAETRAAEAAAALAQARWRTVASIADRSGGRDGIVTRGQLPVNLRWPQ